VHQLSISLEKKFHHTWKQLTHSKIDYWRSKKVKTLQMTKYSTIPLIQHPWYQTDARLSYIPDRQTVPTLSSYGQFFVTALRECALVSYFHLIIKKTLRFQLPQAQWWGLLRNVLPTVKHLNNTLSNCTNQGSFNMSLEKILHTFTWCHKGSQLVLPPLHIIAVDDLMLYEATISV